MGARSVRGASVGDAEGNTRLLHPGPIVVGSNAMAGPSATGICLEGNTTTGQVWKLPSVNGSPTVGSVVNGMVYYDTSRNVARMATELGFLAVGQSNGVANIVTVSNTTAETVLRTVSSSGLVGPRVYRWTERYAINNTSGAAVTYTFRLKYAGITIVFDAASISNNANLQGILHAWISAQGTNPSAMFVDVHTVATRGAPGANPTTATATLLNQTSVSNVDLSSGFSIQSTVQMGTANANASASSWGFLVEALAG
jgi:hypothetical protein